MFYARDCAALENSCVYLECGCFFSLRTQLDDKVGGNALRVTGEMQLLPLLRSEGLRCGPNVLGCFLHCLQQQYCPSNPYHNQLHAAMVSHACLIIVNEVLPSKQA